MAKVKKNREQREQENAFWEELLAETTPTEPCELCKLCKLCELCELCERTDVDITRHHLIPQSRHNKARTKREFSRDEMKNDIALLCPACHAQVHQVFSNQELASYYHTVERLKEHTQMAKFINWVKKRPSGQTIRVKGKSE